MKDVNSYYCLLIKLDDIFKKLFALRASFGVSFKDLSRLQWCWNETMQDSWEKCKT